MESEHNSYQALDPLRNRERAMTGIHAHPAARRDQRRFQFTKHLARVTLYACCAAALPVPSSAQAPSYSETTVFGITPQTLAPGSPDQSYVLSGFDTVNLHNGHLNVVLPLLRINGRGTAGFTMTLKISPPPWTVQENSIYVSTDDLGHKYWRQTANANANWWNPYDPGFGAGVLVIKKSGSTPVTCQNGSSVFSRTLTHLVFTSPDGTEHPLYAPGGDVLLQRIDTNGNCSGFMDNAGNSASGYRGQSDSSAVFEARDGSGWRFTSTDSCFLSQIVDYNQLDLYAELNNVHETSVSCVNGALALPDGTKYQIASGYVQTILDRNGNRVTIGYGWKDSSGAIHCNPSDTTGMSITTGVCGVTDSLGRQTSIATDSSGDTIISYTGQDGTARNIAVTYGGTCLRSVRTGVTAYNPNGTDYTAGTEPFPQMNSGSTGGDGLPSAE